jgi:hypothetical protein
MSACGWGIIAGTFTLGLIVGANVGFLALGLFAAARDEGSPSRDGEVSQDQRSPLTVEKISRGGTANVEASELPDGSVRDVGAGRNDGAVNSKRPKSQV